MANLAAAAHWPVFLKAFTVGRLPLLWRGTRAIALAKPQKDPATLQGWRNIALFEAASKGVCKAVRLRLLQVLKRVTTRGQHGALPGQGLGVPSRMVRGYLDWVRSRNTSAAVLFLDGQGAYYAVLRQHLVGCKDGGDEGLLSLIQAIHPQQEKQDRLLMALMSLIGPGLIKLHGGKGALADYVRMMMRGSWFTTGARDGMLQHTRAWYAYGRRAVSDCAIGLPSWS